PQSPEAAGSPDRAGDPLAAPDVPQQTGPNILSLAFSPDGRFLACGTSMDDGTVRLWDINSGSEVRRFPTPGGVTWSLIFNPRMHGQLIVGTAGTNRAIHVWNFEEGSHQSTPFPFDGDATAIAFHPRGDYVAVAENTGTVHLFTPDGKKGIPKKLVGRSSSNLTFGTAPLLTLFAASDEAMIQFWELRANGEFDRIKTKGGIVGLAVTPDSKTIATSSADKAIRLWDTEIGKEPRKERT